MTHMVWQEFFDMTLFQFCFRGHLVFFQMWRHDYPLSSPQRGQLWILGTVVPNTHSAFVALVSVGYPDDVMTSWPHQSSPVPHHLVEPTGALTSLSQNKSFDYLQCLRYSHLSVFLTSVLSDTFHEDRQLIIHSFQLLNFIFYVQDFFFHWQFHAKLPRPEHLHSAMLWYDANDDYITFDHSLFLVVG